MAVHELVQNWGYAEVRARYVFNALARQNPVLPPRRRAKTAPAHALCIGAIARQLGRASHWARWGGCVDAAARFLIDDSRRRAGWPDMDPAYEEAHDLARLLDVHVGRVWEDCLTRAAGWLVWTVQTREEQPSRLEFLAWARLYPQTASLFTGPPTTRWSLEQILAEWERYYAPTDVKAVLVCSPTMAKLAYEGDFAVRGGEVECTDADVHVFAQEGETIDYRQVEADLIRRYAKEARDAGEANVRVTLDHPEDGQRTMEVSLD